MQSSLLSLDEKISSAVGRVLDGRRLVTQQRKRLACKPSAGAWKRLRFHETSLIMFEMHLAEIISRRDGMPAQW